MGLVPTRESKDSAVEEISQQQLESQKRTSRQAWQQALTESLQKLPEHARDPEAYVQIAECHKRLGRPEDAAAALREGLRNCAPAGELYRWSIHMLDRCNRTAEAIALAHEGTRVFPDDVWLKLQEGLLLPTVYDSAEEIERYRRRYTERLGRICETLSLDTPQALERALAAVGSHVNVRLPYQGRNDRDLQEQYGQLVSRIMAANYPQWAQRPKMPPADDGVLRVGYVSSRFRNLSATKYFLGWLREHDRKRFAVHAYHVGRESDSLTSEVRRISQRFGEFPGALEETCRAILADRLHVLVFLDIGLDPIMTQLAALRLAPVQSMAWDQPVTSGLPAVDYFISGALTEPEGAQDHYSEELVCLPGTGVCYDKPVIPAVLLTKTRADFQLGEEAVVYLCCQYADKYPPGQDAVYATIASQVPHAQFVFLMGNDRVADDFRRRLDPAFSALGLESSDSCVLLRELDRFSYWNLNLLGDVFLDSIGWSGGVSTFEAIACGLPVVTMPGRFMRGRQSYAMLTQMGVTETIAGDQAEYVRIAVRLGLDRGWRSGIVQRMAAGYPALYSDTWCVRALEEFLRRVVDERLREG